MNRKTLSTLCCGLLIGGLASACAEDRSPDLIPPYTRGPFQAALLNDVTPGPGGLELPTLVWGPAATGEEADHNYDGIGLAYGRVIEDSAFDCSAARPVVIFTHGNGGVNFQSFTLTEHLARHGYLVAAPAHVHNTALDTDEDLKPYLFVRRPQDVAATFDWLVGESVRPDSPIAGCVDPAAGYAVVGHSFGGYTTLATAGARVDMVALLRDCEGDEGSGCALLREWRVAHPDEDTLDASDERVWAAVPLAPAWYYYLGAGLAEIDLPVAVVGGELDEVTTWPGAVLPAWAGLTATPRLLAGLAGAGHYSFTDFCAVAGEAADGCGEGFRPVAEVLETVNVLVLAFLQRSRGYKRAGDWLPPTEGIFFYEEVPR